MTEVLMVDRLSPKPPVPVHHDGHLTVLQPFREFAADSLQMQQAEKIGSIDGCSHGGCGRLPAKSRTTCGPNSAIIG
jgi:hypothetical protein